MTLRSCVLVCFVLTVFWATNVQAEIYKVDMELFTKGQDPISASLIIKDGQEEKIRVSHREIKIKAQKQDNEFIKLSTTISEGRSIVTRPTLVMRIGESGSIGQNLPNGETTFSLRLAPTIYVD